MAQYPRIPVTVLTGFLGAGKTSLLNRVLGEPGFADTAVIVNEFGEIGIDGDLVEKADARAFAMTTGCLCCTVSGDIRLTLLRLADDAATGKGPPFARLVIETTGLADPAPVLQSLMTSDLVLDRYALNGVVTVVEAPTGATTLERFREARAQAAVADLVVLTKTDLADTGIADALEARLAALAPNAPVRRAPDVGAADIFGLAALDAALKPPEVADWLRFDVPHAHHAHDHDRNRHDADISAFCFVAETPLNPWAVQDAIEGLQALLGADLLRLKAIVCLDEDPDRPVVLHVVQHVLHVPARLDRWPPGPRQTRLVVIARGPGRTALPEVLAKHLPSLHAPGGSTLAHAAP